MRKALVVLALPVLAVSGSTTLRAAKPGLAQATLYSRECVLALQGCALQYRTAVANNHFNPSISPEDYTAHIKRVNEAKDTCRKLLDKTLKLLRKASARGALKSYHVAFVRAMDGIAQRDGESEQDFNARTQALSDKIDEAWARFEVEN